MSISPQSPGEIYEDAHGERWLVTAICREPTVTMERVGSREPDRKGGAITASMWHGFRKVLDAAPGRR